ncbi:TPM domain-containing protein [Sphingobacterium hungaricum]|uniref:TPM domain-containing protein n=1 Tax=Sphingobacterium hungaricum TaxID=2082723 RepID=A0A928UXX5_9SPHI|nr:TPM domain-containing protein [Sphingobacterium hungaricum]MBE8714018.1 hypothetical protein [Sphingobacterium hungaricum]
MENFSSEDQDRVVQAISLAESKISGEIRLVVERKLHGMSAIEQAQHYFEKLGMTNTILRNGVLLYIATEDHEFAIIGDAGINQRVPDNFWEETKQEMTDFFRKGELANGLIWGITHAAEQLVKFFPSRADDINELPDDIYFGNN